MSGFAGLSAWEERLACAAAAGAWADLTTEAAGAAQPTMRAEVIRALLLGLPLRARRRSGGEARPAAVRLRGARITGALDLEDGAGGGTLPALALERCTIEEPVTLHGARLQRVSLANSALTHVAGRGCRIEGPLDLTGVHGLPRPAFRSGDDSDLDPLCWLDLRGSHLDGGVNAPGARLVAPAPRPASEIPAGETIYALNLADCEIGVAVFLAPSFRAEGGVNLGRARVGGDLFLLGAELTAKEGVAFRGDALHVEGSLVMESFEQDGSDAVRFRAAGTVRLQSARIDASLFLGGAKLTANEENTAFRGPFLRVGGHLIMLARECRVDGAPGVIRPEIAGTINLHGAAIENGLDLRGAHVAVEDGVAIEMTSARVNGDVSFSADHSLVGEETRITPFEVRGAIVLRAAAIGGSLEMHGAKLEPARTTYTLDGRGLDVAGELNLFDAGGGTSAMILLESAHVGRHLRCRGELLGTPTALDGTLLRVDGDLELAGRLGGDALLAGVRVGGHLRLSGLVLQADGRGSGLTPALSLRDAHIEGELHVRRLRVERMLDAGISSELSHIHAIRRRPLACHPGWWLAEALLAAEHRADESSPVTRRPAILAFLWTDHDAWRSNGSAVLLTGAAEPIRRLALGGPPRLRTPGDVRDYLHFIFAYLWYGPPARILWPDDPRLATLEPKHRERIPPMRVRTILGPAGDRYFETATLHLHGRTLVHGRVRVAPDGQPRLTEQEVLGETAADVGEVYFKPLRISTRDASGEFDAAARARSDAWPLPPETPGRWTALDPRAGTGARMLVALRESFTPEPRVDLTDARADRLEDGDGREWGEDVRLLLDGFAYGRSPGPPTRDPQEWQYDGGSDADATPGRRWRSGLRNAWRRVRGMPIVGPLPAQADRHQLRARWLDLQYTFARRNRAEYRPHPYETLAAAFRSEGAEEDARRILSLKLTTERRVRMPWYWRPFSWLFWVGFDYGLSPRRAFITLTLVWLIGWLGTSYANRTGLLLMSFMPSATVVVDGAAGPTPPHGPPASPATVEPGIALAPRGSAVGSIACASSISEAIYALDLMIPIIDMRHDARCELTTASPGPHAWYRSASLWNWLKTAYTILGAIVVSLAVLTFSGVLNRHAQA